MIAVARNMPKHRPTGRQRPVYHEVQPGGVAQRRPGGEERPVPESADAAGTVIWTLVALIALMLIDGYVWNGYYRHQVLVAIDAQAEWSRAWVDGLWR